MSKRSSESAEGKAAATRRRVAAPDLEITVKAPGSSSDIAAGVNPKDTKTFTYNSTVMAFFFGYFDGLLSSGMSESETKQVTLEDMDPDTFEMAVEFLVDPSKVSTAATPSTAMKVVPIYDRLDSEQGLNFVETVILKKFDSSYSDWCSYHPADIRAVLKAITKSKDYKFDNLAAKGVQFVTDLFSHVGKTQSTLLSPDHLLMMQPYLIEHPGIVRGFHDAFCKIPEGRDNYDNDDIRKIEASDPSFPYWLPSKLRAMKKVETYREHIQDDVVLSLKFHHYPSMSDVAILKRSSLTSSTSFFAVSYQPDEEVHIGEQSYNRFEVGPAAVVNLRKGSVGEDYEYDDWAVVLSNIYSAHDRNFHQERLEFVYPHSGSHASPPVGFGWRSLQTLPNGFDFKVHLQTMPSSSSRPYWPD